MYDWSLKQLKRLIVAVIGMTILVIGIAMIVLPGPAIVVIPIALGILATEFAWARRVLLIVRQRIQGLRKQS
jgi:tellurite resistance protein TerC